MINWLQPYAPDKNIGREYNRMIGMMPDGEWIGLVDHDAMFLRPDSKAQIEEVVRMHGSEYQVFGVLTNRLWGEHQRYLKIFSDDENVSNHIKIAEECHKNYYGQVMPTNVNVAGLCMVFNKSTWTHVGGFKEDSILLDKEFTDAVQDNGGKLAICQGVYVFHLYRWGQASPGQYISHLIK